MRMLTTFGSLVAFLLILTLALWLLSDRDESTENNGLLPTSHALSPPIKTVAPPQRQATQMPAAVPQQPLPLPAAQPTPPPPDTSPQPLPQALMENLMKTQSNAEPAPKQSVPNNTDALIGDRNATSPASAVARSLRSSLGIPHQIDATTNLLDIHGEGNSIAYVFDIDMPAKDMLPIVDDIRHNMKDNACNREDFKQLLNYGFSITLRFRSNDGSEAVPVVMPNNLCK